MSFSVKKQKKCSGCQKTKNIKEFKLFENNKYSSRCQVCLDKANSKTIKSTNVLWNVYPELKELSDYKEHRLITTKSTQKIKLSCNNENCSALPYIISPIELLEYPFCLYC